MSKKRIFQVAKELNISHIDIMSFLKENDITVSSHMAPIEDDIYEMVLAEFNKERLEVNRLRKEQARQAIIVNENESMIQEQENSAQENEAILAQAREEAKNIIVQAKEAGDKLKYKFEEDGRTKYDELVQNASEQINAEKQKALNDIKNMVAEIALEASEKIIKRNLNSEDNKKIIDETVNSFQEKN